MSVRRWFILFLAIPVLMSACADPRVVDATRLAKPEHVYVALRDAPKISIRDIRRERTAKVVGAVMGGLLGVAVGAAGAPVVPLMYPDGRHEIASPAVVEPALARLKERLVAGLAVDPKLAGAHLISVASGEAIPRGALTLWVELEKWGISTFEDDLDVYGPLVEGTAKLVRDGDTLWKAHCSPAAGRDPVPFTVAALRADADRLRVALATATDACADELAAAFAGGTTGPGKIRRDRSSVTDAERVLLGTATEAGLVRGARRFEAHFVGVAMSASELDAVHRLIRSSITAPPGSEVKLAGTIAGRPFETKMERSRSGRVRVIFRGVRFTTEAEANVFLTPFAGSRFRKVELIGEAGGQPVVIRREPILE